MCHILLHLAYEKVWIMSYFVPEPGRSSFTLLHYSDVSLGRSQYSVNYSQKEIPISALLRKDRRGMSFSAFKHSNGCCVKWVWAWNIKIMLKKENLKVLGWYFFLLADNFFEKGKRLKNVQYFEWMSLAISIPFLFLLFHFLGDAWKVFY